MSAPASLNDKDYYQMLNVTQNAVEQEINSQFRKLALQYHPDKGGDREDFEKLKEAQEVLTNAARRRAYDDMLKHRTAATFNPSPEIPSVTPEGPHQQVYAALCPLNDIQKEYDKFVKEKIGEAFANEHGYSSELRTDPQTGQQTLWVQFPDKSSADEFVNRLMGLGMIQSMDKSLSSQAEPEEPGYQSPSPWKNPGSTPKLTRD